MKMAIKNYTTTISVNKTIGEIQGILSKHGATAIMTEYDNGNVTGLSFKIMTPRGELGIRLPSNTDRVLQVLKNQRKNNRINECLKLIFFHEKNTQLSVYLLVAVIK
jgi:hypothetical protein